jgi:hypothetical protein
MNNETEISGRSNGAGKRGISVKIVEAAVDMEEIKWA